MNSEFNTGIVACRQAYEVYYQLACRTDNALYGALGKIHELRCRTALDSGLTAAFRELLHQSVGDKPVNETLFLIKYAFFPDTLQPGPGHKSNITKASRYAKLINRALDQGIAPADFVAFAREHGIQRTAASSGSGVGKRSYLRTGTPGRRRSASRVSFVSTSGSFAAAVLAPLAPWFYSYAVASRLAECLRTAQAEPQKLSLTVYVNDEQAVLTGVTGQACRGEFPEAAIRVADAAAALPATPTAVNPPPKRPPLLRKPWLRSPSLALRSTTVPGRQRRGDGIVWPA